MLIHSLRIACAAVVLSATSTFAVDLPIYDAEGECLRFSEKLYSSPANEKMRNIIYNECVRNEQSSYYFLRMVWDELSEKTQKLCIGYMSNSEPDRTYLKMRACALGWLAHDRAERPPEKFRY
jgi:hypothetical protein